MHQSNPKRRVSQNYSKRGQKSSQNTHKKRPIDVGSRGTGIWRIKLQERGADHSQETEARWLEKGRKSAKTGGDEAEAFKGGPNKTTRGDLKGKEADFNGSEREVTDLEKRGLKL